MAAKEKYAEPSFLECGFGELEHGVIIPEICCKCGTCEAFCPRIEHKENKPTLIEYDPLCGLCFAYCPRSFFEPGKLENKLFGRSKSDDEMLGIYRKAVSVQSITARGKMQDGGAVTGLLVHALEEGIIDCAVVTDKDDDWRTIPKVAMTSEEVISAAGTKYTISNSIIAVQEAMEKGCKKIGFVGTPCQIQALRKAQLLDEPYELGQEKIVLLIGLFCMENFDYDALMEGLVKGVFGLSPKDVEKFEIKKGMFRIIDKEGIPHEIKLEETDKFTFIGCGPCFDFSSELADISVGSVGSPDGWSTVLIRTEAGQNLYGSALNAGDIKEIALSEKGLTLTNKLVANKIKRFEKCARELEQSGTKLNIKR
jgi:coenzyme F420 hydrogenase subunit beta